jgi:hypothetical protein
MTKPSIRIHNTETNEVIDREMTEVELVEFQQLKNTEIKQKAEAAAKATQKAALLERLGITEDEARLLLA